MSGEREFLARWSQRKLDPAPEEAVEAPEPAPAKDTRSDEEILESLGLPDPADLKPGDDVAGFMQAAVPERLRRLALRQLWRANPMLANLDGLVDYGDDFTDSATVIENLQTAYQVGKGMLSAFSDDDGDEADDDDPAATGELAEEAPEADETDAPPPAPDDGTPAARPAEKIAEAAPADPGSGDEPPLAGVAATRRRMTFTIDPTG